MEKEARMAFVLISFTKGSKAFLEIVSTISNFEEHILGSIHVPQHQEGSAVFGLLVKANTDHLGAITGKLGKIPGIKVKSAVLPQN